MTGEIFGHFRIIEKLGSGGMGEVWKAEDTKLHRFVALKFLPADMANSKPARERFEREARAIAGLSHPNICVLYDFGEQNGKPFLVMELLQGQTLRDRMQRQPAGFSQLLDWAIQMADALDTAHRAGIIHRDLKPANIFITQHNQAKILDFGLARREETPSAEDILNAETRSLPAPQLTSPGSMLGTVAYMSPEQARGDSLDARSDVFSLGVVLYEAATGQACFQARSTAETFQRILSVTPDKPSRLRPELPAELDRIILRALQKDCDLRYQSAAELRSELKLLRRESASSAHAAQAPAALPSALPLTGPVSGNLASISTPAPSNPPISGPAIVTAGLNPASAPSSDSQIASALMHRHKKTLLAGMAALVVILLAAAYWLAPPLSPPQVSGFTQITHDGRIKFGIATDGSRLYFDRYNLNSYIPEEISIHGGLARSIPTPLPSLIMVNVSPDGTQLLTSQQPVYGASGPLWALPVLGGPPRRLGNAVGSDAAWSPQGHRLAFTRGNELFVSQGDGAGARRIASVPAATNSPEWSLNGKTICFTMEPFGDHPDTIWQVAPNGAHLHEILRNWHAQSSKCCGIWSPDGNYFFFNQQGRRSLNSQIWAQRVTGAFPRRVSHIPVQMTFGTASYGNIIPGKDGKTLFSDASIRRGALKRYDAQSHRFKNDLGGRSILGVNYSKDGQWLAYSSFPEDVLWRSRRDGSGVLQLSPQSMTAIMSSWSPDGRSIAFSAYAAGGGIAHLYLVSPDGSSLQELLPQFPGWQLNPSWSPHGKRLAFGGNPGVGASPIHIVSLAGKTVTTLADSIGFYKPAWSPDGRYLAAIALSSGASSGAAGLRLYNFQTSQWMALTDTMAESPCWSKDGKTIYFLQTGAHAAIMRFDMGDRKIQQVAGLKGLRIFISWMGLAPNGSPLVLKNTGTDDLVSMKWKEP